MQRYEFINKRALFKAQVNDEITASVQIEIEDDRRCKLYNRTFCQCIKA